MYGETRRPKYLARHYSKGTMSSQMTFRMGPYETPCMKAIVMWALSVTILDIFTVEMCMILIFRMGHGQI